MPDDSKQPARRRLMIHGLTPARSMPSPSGVPEQPSSMAANLPTPPPMTAPSTRPPYLIGHGYDLHRLEPTSGKPLTLAGLVVPGDQSPIAHSDGDVVLHAITDALLGALGLGDIGQHFPDNDPTYLNADSRLFIETAYALARKSGYMLSNVDITLLLERPKVAPFRATMLTNLKSFFEPSSVVNFKACTNEGVDAIGEGRADGSARIGFADGPSPD